MTTTAQTFKINVRNKKNKNSKTEEIELKVGQVVRYAFYSNVTFEGFDEKGHVILKDKSGDIKLVYRNLFEQYVEIQD